MKSALRTGIIGVIAVAAALVFAGTPGLQKPEAQPAEAGPVNILGLNSPLCLTLGIAFGGVPALTAASLCGEFFSQNGSGPGGIQGYVRCLRGSDVDGDGDNDCLPFEVGILDIEPEDFAALDLDANQVYQGISFNVILFVDDDAPVLFTSEEGVFQNGDDDYSCVTAAQDPDCDGDATTVGDGVVVARLDVTTDAELGTHTVIGVQEGVGWPLDFTVVGVPNRIELVPLFGKSTIQTGTTIPTRNGNDPLPNACDFQASVAGVLGANSGASKAVIVAKAFDQFDNEVAGVLLDWDIVRDEPTANALTKESDLGGVALPQTPTIDTGALGIAFPQFVCGGTETGTLTLTAKISANVNVGTNPNETASIDIEVVGPPETVTFAVDPPVVDCNGTNTATITATVKTADGENVADGVDVSWRTVALGTANPLTGNTTAGVATTVVTPLAGANTGVTVLVGVGDAEIADFTENDGVNNDDDVATPGDVPNYDADGDYIDSAPGASQVDEEGEVDSDDPLQPNPEFVQSSVLVQCGAGSPPPPGTVPGTTPGGGAGAGSGAPTGIIRGPDTGSAGDLDGRGALSVWPAVALFVAAMGLAGARFALKRA